MLHVMKKTKKNIIIGKKWGDALAGSVCMLFVLICLLFLDLQAYGTWISIGFFGLCSIVLLAKFFNPTNRFVSRDSKEAKDYYEQQFTWLNNNPGIFKYISSGFEINLDGALNKIMWEDIEKLKAFKLDLVALDEICLMLVINSGESFQISESTEGWFLFNRKLKQHFPEINANWEIEIANPAFERNETVLFDRKKAL